MFMYFIKLQEILICYIKEVEVFKLEVMIKLMLIYKSYYKVIIIS